MGKSCGYNISDTHLPMVCLWAMGRPDLSQQLVDILTPEVLETNFFPSYPRELNSNSFFKHDWCALPTRNAHVPFSSYMQNQSLSLECSYFKHGMLIFLSPVSNVIQIIKFRMKSMLFLSLHILLSSAEVCLFYPRPFSSSL